MGSWEIAMIRSGVTLAALCIAATACAPLARPVVDHRGYVPDPEALSSIRPGIDNKDSVESRLGTPTTTANFDSATWYYVSAVERNFLFYRPQVTQQDVIAIKFDKDDLVSSIDHYDLKDAKAVTPVARETPTRGKQLTFMQQMFGNFGHISATDANPTSPTPRN
jgi:outer membrane protein assembly factor BamE (lipoprotein component of BamABCDE complex)